MKVSELTGPLLAYWVARAQGYQDVRIGSGAVRYSIGTISYDFYLSWEECGPIIERERITLYGSPDGWGAVINDDFGQVDYKSSTYRRSDGDGDTPRIAAMRCFVASKYGEEVPDE